MILQVDIPQPGRKPPGTGKTRNIIILAVTALVVAFLAQFVLSGLFPGYGGNPQWVESFSGVDHKVYADSTELVDNFSLNTTSWLNGTFHASGPVSFYVLNQSEYSHLLSGGNFEHYLFADKDNTTGTMNLSFQAEPIYFLLVNPTSQLIMINYSFTVYRST